MHIAQAIQHEPHAYFQQPLHTGCHEGMQVWLQPTCKSLSACDKLAFCMKNAGPPTNYSWPSMDRLRTEHQLSNGVVNVLQVNLLRPFGSSSCTCSRVVRDAIQCIFKRGSNSRTEALNDVLQTPNSCRVACIPALMSCCGVTRSDLNKAVARKRQVDMDVLCSWPTSQDMQLTVIKSPETAWRGKDPSVVGYQHTTGLMRQNSDGHTCQTWGLQPLCALERARLGMRP